MIKYISFTPIIVTYTASLVLFGALCPAGELVQGLIFHFFVLWLATEVWSVPFYTLAMLRMRRGGEGSMPVERYLGRLAKWTAPFLLVGPFGMFLFWELMDYLSMGLASELCGFTDVRGMYEASFIAVAGLFVLSLFSRVLPFSTITFICQVDDEASTPPPPLPPVGV